ncbi:MAG TPA: hypothetical protein VHZ52_13170 [Acidobacteriaceae bacterium]|jgi:hypothetical protein|nr:hypothetical protein [Acidobacteriaceae bacterium]
MTLMDAPKFDAARDKRRTQIFYGTLAGLFVFLVGMWFFTGRPIDYPWNWWTYWAGERDVNQFLQAVENNDLNRAYGIWRNDYDWRNHQAKYATYPFERFQQDWGSDSSANEYGTISSHHIVARKLAGTTLIVGAMLNGRKSKPLFLAYDKNDHTLSFSPFELNLNPY